MPALISAGAKANPIGGVMKRKMEPDAQKTLWKVGRRIGELRKKKGLTQDDLARKMDVTQRLVARWEGRENMKLLTLYRLSKLLKCEVIEFFKSQAPNPRKGPIGYPVGTVDPSTPWGRP